MREEKSYCLASTTSMSYRNKVKHIFLSQNSSNYVPDLQTCLILKLYMIIFGTNTYSTSMDQIYKYNKTLEAELTGFGLS